ncbi:MAG: hypothetical protein E7649_06950 [Ruminococcaceae bacterium]|nr:hypothetical protein [Oscillospiraceae bacterium]
MKYIKTYGIACIQEQNGQCEIVKQIHSVTADPQLIDQMLSLFNEHHLSPIHLEDAVEDLLFIM